MRHSEAIFLNTRNLLHCRLILLKILQTLGAEMGQWEKRFYAMDGIVYGLKLIAGEAIKGGLGSFSSSISMKNSWNIFSYPCQQDEIHIE